MNIVPAASSLSICKPAQETEVSVCLSVPQPGIIVPVRGELSRALLAGWFHWSLVTVGWASSSGLAVRADWHFEEWELISVAIMPREHPLSKQHNLIVTLKLFPSEFLLIHPPSQHPQIREISFCQLRCIKSSTLSMAPEVQSKHTGT